MYDQLRNHANHLEIEVTEKLFSKRIKGLYGENVIWINKRLETSIEKYCVLAEELGHYHTTSGDITDLSKLTNRKQEKRARSWAYEKAVPLYKIIQAHKECIRNKYELAEFFGVTEKFLDEALDRYKEKYGLSFDHKGYTICFEPLGVIEWFDKIF